MDWFPRSTVADDAGNPRIVAPCKMDTKDAAVVKCSTTLCRTETSKNNYILCMGVLRTVLREAFIAINAETRGIHPTGERDTSRSPEFIN